MSIECVAGRVISRPGLHKGLDWTTPCPVPAVELLPFDPPWPLCTPHYRVLVDDLYEALGPQIEAMGYIVG